MLIPYMVQLYETQKQFIDDCKRVISNSNIGIFSSPTGTGKTLSLLLSVINFIQENEYDDILNNIFDTCIHKTRIYYCSRTHNQLSQCINELKKLDTNTNSVIMGSRKIYCINQDVDTKQSIEKINQSCEDLRKNNKCKYFNNSLFIDGVIDIEDLRKEGKRHGACPYYYTTKYYKNCEMIFLPYNILFNEGSRKNYNINLKNSIVIIDEAHNILEAVDDINTVCLDYDIILKCTNILQKCKNNSKSSKSTETVSILIDILNKILQYKHIYLKSSQEFTHESDSHAETRHIASMSANDITRRNNTKYSEDKYMKVDDYLCKTRLVNFNMLEITENIKMHNLVTRIESCDRTLRDKVYILIKFLNLLVNSDKDCMIKLNHKMLKIFPVNTKLYFESFLECKSIVFAGGTMEPIHQLKNIFDGKRIVEYFSYPSICDRYQGYIVNSIAEYEFELKEKTRDLEIVKERMIYVIDKIMNNVKSGGVVIFVPSKQYLNIIKCHYMHAKNVFFEYDHSFGEYSEFVSQGPGVLFAVVGGKLSEGTNFSDDLCRVLVIFGIPFSCKSGEIDEKIQYYGKEWYLQNAMKKVNQTIGRAMRHKNDHACILLIDKRYMTYKNEISPWLHNNLSYVDFDTALQQTIDFLERQD